MPNAPRFLDKIVSLTSSTDLDMMEFSLLKTLEEFISTQHLRVLKFDRNGNPCYQQTLGADKHEIIWENIEMSDEIRDGIDVVKATGQPYVRQIETNMYQTIWEVLQENYAGFFLVVTSINRLDKLDTHLIKGLLGIYRNFYHVLSDSQRDQLTGLYNRKTFDDVINKIYVQRPSASEPILVDRRGMARKKQVDYWLAMADLDNFKRVNDTWGHLYGDEVLLLTAQLMLRHFRENDYLFRFGGEEFIILFQAPNADKAKQALERFRLAMESMSFPQVGQMTISIGTTKMDPSVFTVALLDRADKAMYHSKHNGRNQISFYEDILEKGLVKENEIVSGEIELF